MDKKKNIVVCSGKGGVGKSMLSSCLAKLFSQKRDIVAVDADVDAPNLHLWLGQKENWDKKIKVSVIEKAVVVKQPSLEEIKKNIDICQFGALEIIDGKLKINSFLCEGCGACEVVFPSGTIKLNPVVSGEIKIKDNVFGFPLVSAQLYPGQTGSGKIVSKIKEKAAGYQKEYIITDAPAGMGCPVIAALNDADFALLITEPTPSGFADLKRIHFLVNHFKIPFGVAVNKWDINPKTSKKIINWAGENYLGKISYDQKIFKAIASLTPVFKTDLIANEEILLIFKKLIQRL